VISPSLTALASPAGLRPGRSGIEVHGLTKSFGTTQVLKGVDFAVESGTAVALLGPNGAGKTTTVRILATLLQPDGGRALVGGYDVVTEVVRARSVLGLTGQETSVDGLLTGRENLVMIGRLSRLSTRAAKRRADELLDLMDLQGAADRQSKTYSGGMRRRLDLAASLVATPPIMLLDEPTTGLDPLARQRVRDAIRRLMDQGTTVLLTTQYLAEADLLADRIVLIDDGEVVAEGTPKSLKSQVGSERAELTFADRQQLAAAAELLADQDPITEDTDASLSLAIDDPWQLQTILHRLQGADLKPLGITVTQPTLDDVFITVTNTPRPTRGGEPG
jgi:daunorubicin resistance ABC transporter ATP-binding subunit